MMADEATIDLTAYALTRPPRAADVGVNTEASPTITNHRRQHQLALRMQKVPETAPIAD